MGRHLCLFFLALTFLLSTSCDRNRGDEPIPGFLYIEDIAVNTDFNTQGSNTDNIVDCWVFVDDEAIGVWEMPAKIPVPLSGTHSVKVQAGIRNNGISASRLRYLFYSTFETTHTFSPARVDTIKPVVQYADGINIWIEDFDDPGFNFANTSLDNAQMSQTQEPELVLEGSGSGKAIINSQDPFFEVKTGQDFVLPGGGTSVFLEMDYSCTNSASVGLFANLGAIGESKNLQIILNRTTQSIDNPVWNKIYIELTEIASSQFTAENFEIYIDGSLDPDRTEGLLLFDNIKLIYP